MVMYTYLFTGTVETFIGFWSFSWVFSSEGFQIKDLWHTNSAWATEPQHLEPADQDRFMNLCLVNTEYSGSCADTQQWYEFRKVVLQRAQAAYFLHIVWSQFGNILCRRTQVNSGISWERMNANPYLLLGMVFSFFVAIAVVYLPGLNTICQVDPISTKYMFTGVWVLPVYIAIEELRKYFIRRDLPRHNWLYRLTVY